MRFARAQCVLYLLMIFICYLTMFLGVRSAAAAAAAAGQEQQQQQQQQQQQEGGGQGQGLDWLNLLHQFLGLAGMCLCPCTAMVVSGWFVFITLPCVVVTDHIRRSARGIAAASVLAIELQQAAWPTGTSKAQRLQTDGGISSEPKRYR